MLTAKAASEKDKNNCKNTHKTDSLILSCKETLGGKADPLPQVSSARVAHGSPSPLTRRVQAAFFGAVWVCSGALWIPDRRALAAVLSQFYRGREAGGKKCTHASTKGVEHKCNKKCALQGIFGLELTPITSVNEH